MNEYALITAYNAMLFVARHEGIEIEDKYEKLDEIILEKYDLEITDMMDNIESFYDKLKELPSLQEDEN